MSNFLANNSLVNSNGRRARHTNPITQSHDLSESPYQQF
jgi:hypothetical protein